MRFTTFLLLDEPRLGVVADGGVIDLARAVAGAPADLRTALETAVDLRAAAQRAIDSPAPRLARPDLSFAPLVPNPGKTICLGLNYFDHAKEGGREKPEY